MTAPLKEQLFEIGVRALSQLAPNPDGLYACPICSLLFPADAISSGDLTLEHVPPASAGGRGITLTCKPCNSTAGHTVDADHHGRERFFGLGRAVSGQGDEFVGPVKLTISGIPTNATLVWRGGRFILEIRQGQNNPKLFEEQIEAVKQHQQNPVDGMTLSLNARVKFNFDRSRVSDLRAAYLAAFAQFGYRYAFDRRLHSVREQIQRPDEPLIDGAWWTAGPEFPEDPMMLVLTAPFPALLVRLRSILVLLPWIGSPEDLYGAVRSHFSARPALVSFDVLSWPTTMEMLLDLREDIASEDSPSSS
jgi:hypothetical protein